MGCDGGTIQKHSEMVQTKKKTEKKDKNELARIKFTSCTLSLQPLSAPIACDYLGNLFNKEAVVRALLEKRMPKELDHISGLKDIFEIHPKQNPNFKNKGNNNNSNNNLTKKRPENFLLDDLSNEMPFICPLTDVEVGGKTKFFVISTCGCMLSEKAFKQMGKLALLNTLLNNTETNNNNNNNNNNNSKTQNSKTNDLNDTSEQIGCLVCGKTCTRSNIVPLTLDPLEYQQLKQQYMEKKAALGVEAKKRKQKKKAASHDPAATDKKSKVEPQAASKGISGATLVAPASQGKGGTAASHLSDNARKAIYGSQTGPAKSSNLFTLNIVK